MSKITVTEYRGLDGLAAIKEDWQTILTLIPDYQFFHTWEWYSAYLSSLAEDTTQWFFLLCLKNNTPVGVLPFSRQRLKKAGFKFTLLASPAHSNVDLAELLISPKDSLEIWSACVGYLKNKTTLRWDMLYSRKILEGSSTLNAITTLSMPHFSRVVSGSAYMSCRAESSHLDKLSNKFKSNIRRYRKRAEKSGRVTFHYIDDIDDLPDAYAKFLQIESSGWKGEDGEQSAVALNPGPKQFYTSLYELYPAGTCRIHLMQVGDEYVSAQFCLVHKRVLHLFKNGYNEAWKNVGPGAIHLFDLLTRCTEDPSIDAISLVTSPPWAERWHPDELKVFEMIVFNVTLKALLYRMLCKLYVLKEHVTNCRVP